METPKLIQDLGLIEENYIRKDTGKLRKRRYGIFECPICKKHFKSRMDGKFKKCTSCANRERNTKHGYSRTRLYNIWKNMLRRTFDEKCNAYKDYGARGIIVCDEWRNDFMVFYSWALSNGYKNDLTIDRINNDGNYEPSNCRWSSFKVQERNKRLLISTNKTGYRGVHLKTKEKKYYATITVNYKIIHLGSYTTALDGAKAYDKYVIDNNLEHTINGVL